MRILNLQAHCLCVCVHLCVCVCVCKDHAQYSSVCGESGSYVLFSTNERLPEPGSELYGGRVRKLFLSIGYRFEMQLRNDVLWLVSFLLSLFLPGQKCLLLSS